MNPSQKFNWAVVAPGGPANMALAVEASRSGAMGFVNLEDHNALRWLRQLPAQTAMDDAIKIGIKLEIEALPAVLDSLPPSIAWIILSRPATTIRDLAKSIAALHRKQCQAIIETVSVTEAVAAEKAGADTIIVKGNEGAGRVSQMTTFILLQQLHGKITVPMWAQGGIGLHTAAPCRVSGAAGAVLDWQVALAQESHLPESMRAGIASMDGIETTCVGQKIGECYRLLLGSRKGLLQQIEEAERQLTVANNSSRQQRLAQWRHIIADTVARGGNLKIGQDVSFAQRLAEKFRTISSMLAGLDRSVRYHCARAKAQKPLAERQGIAREFGIRYPIAQGPMSRVSDVPEFAAAVSDAGGLPFVAVAMMGEQELETMLAQTQKQMGDRPWGIGLLGFLNPDFYASQLKVLRKFRPAAAVIAGGQPRHALALKKENIRAYLHVPSHRLLKLYLEDGTKFFIFEGCECGGHIGQYASFVLWENSIEILLAHISSRASGESYDVWFAGGIGSPQSAAMVAALSAPLVDKGVNVGVLIGTAYLMTREAVTTGALKADYQKRLIDSNRTIVLDSGGGYKVRSAPCEFSKSFETEKQKLVNQGLAVDKIRSALEKMLLGRLRMAAKGVAFNEKFLDDNTVPETKPLSKARQKQEGLFMAGQVIGLNDRVYSIADLHHRIADRGMALLQEAALQKACRSIGVEVSHQCRIAIIGMSAIFPGANDVNSYWENIMTGVYTVSEVPAASWNWRTYFDDDPKSRDKIYSRWGGFIDPIKFDPLKYGIPPNSLKSIDPAQLMTLEIADRALRDAGYGSREFDRENTSVFVGEGGGIGNLGQLYCLRSLLPMFMAEVPEAILGQLPEWTEDSFPGLLPNVIAGRIANCFNLGGTNLSVSAACAAGLSALYLAVDELVARRCRMSIVAAVDVQQNPFTYMCFSKTTALSPTGTPRCFDQTGDGITISQGVGAVVLKRLDAALRDGDTIYAVIRGIGSSSDGRGKSLTAPTSHGQMQAMHRAYQQAGFGPDSIELIEAHGTGTVLGDSTEARSIKQALTEAGAEPASCAVGTVKSMIGHSKGCAGIAGLIKTALALHHKVLPPTLWVEKPAAVDCWGAESPAYINTKARPWLQISHPRRAGVSAFGFGGTNFHAVLEEFTDETVHLQPFPMQKWPVELFNFSVSSPDKLVPALVQLEQQANKSVRLCDLAYTNHMINRGAQDTDRSDRIQLVLVAESIDDLKQKLAAARHELAQHPQVIDDPRGIYFSTAPLARQGKIAFVFPGQGSQRVDMLKDLTLFFPEIGRCLSRADRALAARLPRRLSRYIFPEPRFTDAETQRAASDLMRTDIAQPALGAAEAGMCKLLHAFDIKPDITAGHSSGEYVALWAAGVFDEHTLYDILSRRGSCMQAVCRKAAATMMVVKAEFSDIEPLLRQHHRVYAANFNTPRQTVLAGRRDRLRKLARQLKAAGTRTHMISVSGGFHSPCMAMAAKSFARDLAAISFGQPVLPVYSNNLAAVYPEHPTEFQTILDHHLTQPVKFVDEINKMFADGARLFIEVGPGNVCTGLISEILQGRRFAAVACDSKAQRHGIVQLLHAFGRLLAQGVPMRLDGLFNRRTVQDLRKASAEAKGGRSKVTWIVAPEMSWPATEPRPMIEPVRLSPEATNPVPVSDVLAGQGANQRPAPQTVVPSVKKYWKGSNTMPQGRNSELVIRYQNLMATFLEQQKEVMLAYLGKYQTVDLPSAGIETDVPPVAMPASPSPAAHVAVETETPSTQTTAKAQPATKPKPKVFSAVDIQEKLMQLVAEKTGYPVEMLDPDLDIDADLGIDSIKRVEIVTIFLKQLPGLEKDLADELVKARTLGEVSQIISQAVISDSTDGSASAPTAAPDEANATIAPVDEAGTTTARAPKRYLVVLKSAPLPAADALPPPQGVIVITDDGHGLAADLQQQIQTLGGQAVIVGLKGRQNAKKGRFIVNLADAARVKSCLARIRQHYGGLGGIVHLLPLRKAPAIGELSENSWQQLVGEEVKGLFYLLRYAADDLKDQRRCWVISCAGFDGATFEDTLPVTDCPWRGGLAGLVKTVGVEWPESLAKFVAFNQIEPMRLLPLILAETHAPINGNEVYYRADQRLVPEPLPQEVDQKQTLMDIDSRDVILIIGGARGITAQVARELADLSRATLILVGRSAWPDEESGEMDGLKSESEIKHALFESLKSQGKKPRPKEVAQAAQRTLMDREMRQTREALEAAGATVFYYQADVRDEGQIRALLQKLYKKHGQIDGVVFGVGLIDDKLIADKDPASFDRVFDAKTKSIFNLVRFIKPDMIKFFVIFSSIAGWLGNRGQVDYVAANEVLNRMAINLNARWNKKVAAIDWGPWEQTGMVTDGVRKQFQARGVDLISPTDGRNFFRNEIRYGKTDDSLVVAISTTDYR